MRRGSAPLPAVLLLAVPLLAGCGGAPALDRQAMLQQVMQNYRASLLAADPDAAVPAAASARPGAAPASLVRATQLLGYSTTAVVHRLGEPKLRRNEGPAQIWLYQGRYCSLDLVLDRDPGTPLRVSYAAARASGATRQTEADCLAELTEGRG